MLNFLHSGDLGDIIFALPTIKGLGGGRLLFVTQPGLKPFTPARLSAIVPLLEAQPYIEEVRMVDPGDRVDYDFTEFRRRREGRTLAEDQALYIQHGRWSLTDPWLEVDAPEHGRIVIARSPRYQNEKFDWPAIVSHYGADRFLFIGLPEEHLAFCVVVGAEVEYRPTSNFLEVARLIKGSPLFIGNQSCPNAVAEGMKHPLIQESCDWARDCIFPRPNAQHVFEGTGILPVVGCSE